MGKGRVIIPPCRGIIRAVQRVRGRARGEGKWGRWTAAERALCVVSVISTPLGPPSPAHRAPYLNANELHFAILMWSPRHPATTLSRSPSRHGYEGLSRSAGFNHTLCEVLAGFELKGRKLFYYNLSLCAFFTKV